LHECEIYRVEDVHRAIRAPDRLVAEFGAAKLYADTMSVKTTAKRLLVDSLQADRAICFRPNAIAI